VANLFDGATEPPELRLSREWVASATCVECGQTAPVRRPWVAIHRAGRAAACPDCGGLREPETVSAIGATSPHAGETLATLGVAPDDVVRVVAGAQTCFARLAGDRSFAESAAGSVPSGADAGPTEGSTL
jgi:hypothetical protein